MIQMRTLFDVADNSGQPRAVHQGARRFTAQYAGLGDVIVVSIKEALPNRRSRRATSQGGHRSHEAKCPRPDGSYIRFDTNSAVLVNAQMEPIGTRIFGPVARELRGKKFMKIISLAPEVL